MRYGRRVGSDREHELARTATAAGSATTADPPVSLGAAAWVLPGHWEIKTISDLLRSPVIGQGEFNPQQVGDSVPPAMAGKVRRDDLLQHVEHVPDGELTVCACSVPTDLDPAAERRMMAHLSDIVVRCKYAEPGDQLVVLAVPPQQRFD
jgi:hypothetical protein